MEKQIICNVCAFNTFLFALAHQNNCKYQALFSIIMQNVTSFLSNHYHPTHNQSYLLVEHDVIVKFVVDW